MSAREPATVRLVGGEALTVTSLEPPLGPWADRIEFWWRDVRAPLVAGDLAATSRDRFVVGEIAGRYAGSMSYHCGRERPEVAVLEMVWTHPEHRRKGVARTLLRRALAEFRAGGGLAPGRVLGKG